MLQDAGGQAKLEQWLWTMCTNIKRKACMSNSQLPMLAKHQMTE